MAKIIIKRPSDFINSIRKIGIYNNDEKIGEIKNGETKTFTIEAGVLNLVARIDWYSSENIKISINDGESKTFNLLSRNPNNPYAVSLAQDKYIYLKPEDS